MNNIDEKEWTSRQDYLALAEDRVIGVQRPIFTSGIRISILTREKTNPHQPTVFQPTVPPGFPEIPELETALHIEFECAGAAASAFHAEFLKLVDKYNHWENSVYIPPDAKKSPLWKKLCRIFKHEREAEK